MFMLHGYGFEKVDAIVQTGFDSISWPIAKSGRPAYHRTRESDCPSLRLVRDKFSMNGGRFRTPAIRRFSPGICRVSAVRLAA